MQTRFTRGAIAAIALCGVGLALSVPAGVAAPQGKANGPRYVPNRFIVVLQDNIDSPGIASAFARNTGASIDTVYTGKLRGFAGNFSAARARAISLDPRVKYVEQDQIVSIQSKKKGGGSGSDGGTTTVSSTQVIPTGVSRIDADLSSTANINGVDDRVNATVAILDTGIQLNHPDLNVVLNKQFIASTGSGHDSNGHGTHVAGIAGAKDNTVGVVGVAPGVKLWALKVLSNNGTGLVSNIIAGVNYVSNNASTVDVANLSLGVPFSQALNDAIQNCVNAGVVVVVAAGNSSVDVSGTSPASAQAALTVSALADSDGQSGGTGPATPYGGDDSMAWFSNYGAGVDLIAPGVNILSTNISSGYNVRTGTSQAAPHVAGAAALWIAKQRAATGSRPTPAATRTALLNNGELPSLGYWFNDWDGFTEHLVNANGF